MTIRTEVFLTREVQAQARVEYWNEVANSILGAIAIRPSGSQFNGQIRRRHFGEMQLVQIRSTPVSVNGLHGSSTQGLFLLANRQGRCRLSQGKRETWLEPGELTLLRTEEPYRIEFGQAHETLVLHLPVSAESHCWDDHMAVAHGLHDSELLVSFMERLSAVDGAGSSHLMRTTLDLLELTWPRPRPTVRRESAVAWEQRVRLHVEQHLEDPEMDAEAIAESLGISTRYVHAIFARMGTSASAYIQESRLQRVARRLQRDPAARIGDIAYATGFNDLSHFCRAFRKRFGSNARAFRAGALATPD